MLSIYGSLLPLRMIEEIHLWKKKEKEHTRIIQNIIPQLEEPYSHLLQQWDHVFASTENLAGGWLRQATQRMNPSSVRTASVEALLERTVSQSKEFGEQLRLMIQESRAVAAQPAARFIIENIANEAEHIVVSAPALSEQLRRHGSTSSPDGSGNEQDPVAADAAQTDEQAVETNDLESPSAAEAAGEDTETALSRSDALPTQHPVPIGKHSLPPLPYAYNALEPYIDETTMRLHHDKHHLSYVEGLNKAELMMKESRRKQDFSMIKYWEREAAFHGAGHYLHCIFWNTMNPDGGGVPNGPIAKQINTDFGSFDAFQRHYSAAAEKVEGSGWTLLVWSPRSHRLEILQAEKHQNLSQWDVIPLLALDVWEHAYYLKYQNARQKYIDAWWNCIYWKHVNERFSKARILMWYPY